MKILLVLKQHHFVRPFIGTLRELTERGHVITVAWQGKQAVGAEQLKRDLDFPGITVRHVPGHRGASRREVATFRRAANYLRYLAPAYRDAAKLRGRAFLKFASLIFEKRSGPTDAWGEFGTRLTDRERARLQELLTFVEALLPPDEACDAIVADEQPDTLLVSPLVELNSSVQVEFVKSAQRRGIPVGMLVYSWDNLSTKGGLHVMPDKVFVWNERQRREAVRLHGVPKDRLVVTGAPRFDAYAACHRHLTRDTFAAAAGLDPIPPIVAYLCSSAFVAGDEMPFIRRWLAALRRSKVPALRDCNVIVRPHPDVPLVDVAMPAERVTWPELPDVAADIRRPFEDPRAIVMNTSSVNPQGLFEYLTHATAVVGLNTSAEIEAALVGKPVFTVEMDGSASSGQRGTLHFYYLLKENGGFVEHATSLDEHCAQLEPVLVEERRRVPLIARKARRFVRPHGWDIPVSTVLADAIERELRPACPA